MVRHLVNVTADSMEPITDDDNRLTGGQEVVGSIPIGSAPSEERLNSPNPWLIDFTRPDSKPINH
jgi:hypothetical protein